MKKNLNLLVMSLIVALSIGANVTAAEKSYIYKSTTNDVVVTYTEKVTDRENGIVGIVTSNNDEITQTILSPDFTTKNWEFAAQRQGTKVAAVRDGNVIKLAGRFKGKEMFKELKIDSRPWFQNWDLPFGAFVLSGKAKQEFWTVRNDLKEFVMVLLREKEEPIKINGQSMTAVKVKVTLTGWMSAFWSVHYWFRKSDGVFVRYEGANGPPGTPVTVIELVKEG